MASSHAIIFSLLMLTSSALTINAASYTAPSPAPSPAHHRHLGHGHHHHHSHPQSQPPTQPPATAPATTYPSRPPTPPPATPPTPPPAKPPTTPAPAPAYPPVKPPTPVPAKPPSIPSYPRKLVAIQGVVYCKNCTYAGIDTLLGASPLQGAKVEVRCRNTRYLIKGTATTDKNGYFFLKAPPLITTYGARKCRAYLDQKPKHGGACGKATNINGGVTGGLLFLDKSNFQSNNQSKPALPNFALFNVGPFAYEPTKCYNH